VSLKWSTLFILWGIDTKDKKKKKILNLTHYLWVFVFGFDLWRWGSNSDQAMPGKYSTTDLHLQHTSFVCNSHNSNIILKITKTFAVHNKVSVRLNFPYFLINSKVMRCVQFQEGDIRIGEEDKPFISIWRKKKNLFYLESKS
jgi:hypothetical protein